MKKSLHVKVFLTALLLAFIGLIIGFMTMYYFVIIPIIAFALSFNIIQPYIITLSLLAIYIFFVKIFQKQEQKHPEQKHYILKFCAFVFGILFWLYCIPAIF